MKKSAKFSFYSSVESKKEQDMNADIDSVIGEAEEIGIYSKF